MSNLPSSRSMPDGRRVRLFGNGGYLVRLTKTGVGFSPWRDQANFAEGTHGFAVADGSQLPFAKQSVQNRSDTDADSPGPRQFRVWTCVLESIAQRLFTACGTHR